MPGRSIWILLTMVVAAATAALVLHEIERSRVLRTALTSTNLVWLDHDQDNHSVDIVTIENGMHETKFVLIKHVTMTDEELFSEKFNAIREKRKSYPTFPELKELGATRSSFESVVRDAPNPESSGVWIDGRKLPNDGDLVVAYTSDTRPAAIVEIPKGERAAFFDELWHSKSPFVWLDRWILPRLPKIIEQQTKTMANR